MTMEPRPTPPIPSPYLTSHGAAAYLLISIKQLYRLIQAKDIPYRKLGVEYRFRQDELDVWMEQQPGQAAPTADAMPALGNRARARVMTPKPRPQEVSFRTPEDFARKILEVSRLPPKGR